eukprot:CAMPEP_0114525412 /NCGR_PEP_ID=MMETSP0109-20121206/22406_1 /TAXON_ID=29199 /ORGANISM="Chlorarachnion reptans, Strain CCCM449" /LENGTH=765 /DNA_ID=CAMNT_0001706983 /DNA_START=48 /DNA_END=2348 /DNA_ORIENTATION=-
MTSPAEPHPPPPAPGFWGSPITPDHVVEGGLRLSDVRLSGGVVFWRESRPKEKGRGTVCSFDTNNWGGKTETKGTVLNAGTSASGGDTIKEVTPALNVGSRVQEYGGSPFLIGKSQIVVSTKSGDLQCGKLGPTTSFSTIVSSGKLRFADGFVHEDGSLVMICEDHTENAPDKVKTSIVRIHQQNGTRIETVAEGRDFYHSPRWKGPGSATIAYVAYDHPNMPWDKTSLYLHDMTTGGKECIAEDHSIVQVKFSPRGKLFWMDDRTGFWNLYYYNEAERKVIPVFPSQTDMAGPQWQLGQSYWDFVDEEHIVTQVKDKLGIIDVKTRQFKALEGLPYTSFAQVRCDGQNIAFIGGSSNMPAQVAVYNMVSKTLVCLRKCLDMDMSPFEGYISEPQHIEFPTTGERTAFLYYYAPVNERYDKCKSGEILPPLIVRSHGGPTSCARKNLNLRYQFWTSRGFAIADVNYGGSTGYGREYRNRLKAKEEGKCGYWGIVDVDDCCKAAEFLVAEGKAHPKQLIITGGSAGGFTTLASLCFRKTFSCGASYYGVSDLEALAKDTHKFESRYLDSLVGPYPEAKKVYQERSSITYPERFSAPLILFQGIEDKVVPPNQARTMFEALKKKGIYSKLVEYEGEAHGFRQAKNMTNALSQEYEFYCQVISGGFLTESKEGVGQESKEGETSIVNGLKAKIQSVGNADVHQEASDTFGSFLPSQLAKVNNIKANTMLEDSEKREQIKAVFQDMQTAIEKLETLCLSAIASDDNKPQ